MMSNQLNALLFAALLMGGLVSAPGVAEAQCVQNVQTSFNGTYQTVIKTLSRNMQCRKTTGVGATCYPNVVGFVYVGTPAQISARVTISAPKAKCGWVCTCPGDGGDQTITIDGSDGLPVELMSFSVDDEETGE